MATEFSEADYLTGRLKYPPWFQALKQKDYEYASNVSVTNGATTTLGLSIQSDSYFMAEGLTIIPAKTIGGYESVQVQISDTTISQPWSSAPVNLRDIAGRGDNPKWFTDPNLLRPSSTLNIQISNNTGTTQVFYVTLFGRKVYGLTTDQVSFLTRRLWFQYILPVPAILAGVVSAVGTVNIFNESDFLVKGLLSTTIHQFVVNAASAGAVSSEIMMQLRDQTSDNSFFSQKTPVRGCCGSLWAPYLVGGASFSNGKMANMKRPLLIRRNGTILGEFDNLSATNLAASTGYITLEGVRVFDAT